MPTKWRNAAHEQPNDNQSVLISVNGIYYDAVYHKGSDLYLPKKFNLLKFSPIHFTVYWCEISPPPDQGQAPSKI